jgi:hypothetical protein
MSLESVEHSTHAQTVATMIRTFKSFLAAALLAFGFSLPASAVTSGTDFTDLWWNPAEPGWGVNVIHQNGVIFATLFVFDSAGNPHFYAATNTVGTGNSFSGSLSEGHGTYFGAGSWGAFTSATVGNFSMNFSGPNSGTLTYNVGGVSVSKQIQRFTFGTDNLSGNYLGGMTAVSVCGGATQNSLIFDTLRVTQSGNSVSMQVVFFNNAGVQSQCNYSGSYTPMGRLGNMSGSYNCTIGGTAMNGTFQISNIESSQYGWNGRFTGSDNFCSSHTGFFGGVKDVQ